MNTSPPSLVRTGFTLAEIVIATIVFSLFITGLFGLYRMGSGMFQAGSWKQQKQKEAERFLASLKERLEQVSHAAVVNPAGSPQLTESLSQIGYVDGIVTSASIGPDTRRVLLFIICKPSIAGAPGLLLYHGVRAIPTPGRTGLFDLEMISTTNPDHPFFTGTAFTFFPNGAPDLTRFNQASGPAPEDFRLGGNPNIIHVSEIAAMTIQRTGVASGSLLSITLEFKHPNPRQEKTHVVQRIVSRIEVPAASFTLGNL